LGVFKAEIGFTLICPPIAFSTLIIVQNFGFVPSEIRLLAAENQPVEVSNANGQILFPMCYLTHLEVPAGNSTFSSTGIFWIGERVLG
jgi:hypothetical protein